MATLLLAAPRWAQCTVASATFRNGSGINPPCLTSLSAPLVGSTWRVQVDASVYPGATASVVQGRKFPSNGPMLEIGELLFSLSGGPLFTSIRSGSGATIHDISIPLFSELVGVSLTIQGILRKGSANVRLCNAEDVVLGDCTAALVADFSASPTSGSAPLRVSFTDTSTGGVVSSWLWDFGDGGTSTAPNPVYVYDTDGTYSVSLQVDGPAGPASVNKPDLVRVAGTVAPQELLVVLLDDVSVADLTLYALDPNLPAGTTPNIDALADAGIVFDTAWASPACAATRAALLTGRYGFRTGIGGVITSANVSLGATELTLPAALETYADAGFEHAAFGKWELDASNTSTTCAPTLVHGFDLFAGTALAAKSPCDWGLTTCPPGVLSSQTSYLPARIVDVAVDWITARSGPWFAYLAPQSPYERHRIPPTSLQSLIAGPTCGSCPAGMERTCFLAALQAFDTKLGDLLNALGPGWEDRTTIVFTADNGTPNNALAYWPPTHGKGTLYEGGLHVPMIVAGRAVAPALRGTRSAALVGVTDVFRTLTSIAGGQNVPSTAAEDSFDVSALLQDPTASPGRATLFAERFSPNALAPPYAGHTAAIRDARYKVVYDCATSAAVELYDLWTDPTELDDLLTPTPPAPGSPEELALEALVAELEALIDC